MGLHLRGGSIVIAIISVRYNKELERTRSTQTAWGPRGSIQCSTDAEPYRCRTGSSWENSSHGKPVHRSL